MSLMDYVLLGLKQAFNTTPSGQLLHRELYHGILVLSFSKYRLSLLFIFTFQLTDEYLVPLRLLVQKIGKEVGLKVSRVKRMWKHTEKSLSTI